MFKKIITIFLVVLLLSGCTVDYSIDISKELIIDESIKVNEKTSSILTHTMDVDLLLKTVIDEYKKIDKYSKYVFEDYSDSGNSYVIAKKYYLDIDDYEKDNVVYDYLFKTIEVDKKENIYTFKFDTKNLEDVEIFMEDELYSNLIDRVSIKIKLPFKVVEHNADVVNTDLNSYSWNINKEEELTNILIKFDISKTTVKKETLGVYSFIGAGLVLVAIGVYVYYRYKSFEKV